MVAWLSVPQVPGRVLAAQVLGRRRRGHEKRRQGHKDWKIVLRYFKGENVLL